MVVWDTGEPKTSKSRRANGQAAHLTLVSKTSAHLPFDRAALGGGGLAPGSARYTYAGGMAICRLFF